MILSDTDVLAELERGNIKISDFDRSRLGTNSYDVTLGKYFYAVRWQTDFPIYRGPIVRRVGDRVSIPRGGTLLAMTSDIIGTFGNVVASLRGRSSTRRTGITICDDAGLGDIGYHNHWTMELTSHVAVGVPSLAVGDRIGQVVFYYTKSLPTRQYSGQYNENDWPLCMIPKAYRHMVVPFE